ncbi:MAG: sodium:calcium antiporter, partial [Betaproteobacteria bacterium]
MLIAGIALLIGGGELLVRGASKLAVSLGISPLVVGLTVVAFGTSSPELAVSVQAALSGQVDIALGNVVGSNIFNVLFILGLAALIAPLIVSAQIVRQEVPIMIGASLLLAIFALDGSVVRWEAGLLFAMLVGYTVFLILQSRRESRAIQTEYAADTHLGAQR